MHGRDGRGASSGVILVVVVAAVGLGFLGWRAFSDHVRIGGPGADAGTAKGEAEDRIDERVRQLALRLEDSRHDEPDPARQDDRGIALARMASGTDGDPAVVAARGRVMRDGGATLVVRFNEPYGANGQNDLTLTRCVRFEIEHPWYAVETTDVDCPEVVTPVSIPPPPTTLPFLGGLVPQVQRAVEALPPAARSNADTVAAAVRAVAGGDGAVVESATRGGVVNVSVARGIDCILVRIETTVEVWSPGVVSKVYRVPGEGSCGPMTAYQRAYQHAPH